MKYGLLLASHIIEEWRQYYIQYDVLKRTIDSLVLQVHGGDDVSLSSGGTSSFRYKRCSTLMRMLIYIFSCCLRSHTRDEDVLEAHEEKKAHVKPFTFGSREEESPPRTPRSRTPKSTHSVSGHFAHAYTPPPRSKHYASLRSPFTLVQNAKDTMAKSTNYRISLTSKEEKQSLIDHAYSPPVASYSPNIAIAIDKLHIVLSEDVVDPQMPQMKYYPKTAPPPKTVHRVQGYKIDSKSLAIEKWTELIFGEADKVNKFYLNIEHQLLSEYEQILSKVDKLYKLLNAASATSSNTTGSTRSASDLLTTTAVDNDVALKSSHSLRDTKRFLEPLRIKKRQKTARKKTNREEKRNIHLYQMKLNLFILYQRFIALSNFRTLNQIGFRKILKKFDKNMGSFEQQRLMVDIEEMAFVESVECNECMNDLISAYSNLYEGGDFHKAKVKLLDSMSWSRWSARSSFKMGLKIGVLIGFIGWSISALSVDSGANSKLLPRNAIYAYRCVGCFLSFLWFWSADVYIWSKYRINYVFIFEFEPRTRLTFLQYFDEAATLSLIYFLNCVIFLKSAYWIPARYIVIWPTALLIFFILRTFLPIFEHWKSRQCMIDAVIQTIIAPFGRVRFRDFFMGDVLTSLVKVLADLYLALCVLSMDEYYTADEQSFCVSSSFTKAVKPICICAPYWFRFAQCLNRYFNTHDRVPHLPNAVKYGTAMSVTLLGTLHSSYSIIEDEWSTGRCIWLVATIISTCYLIFWDLVMDWTLFKKQRIKEYPKYWYYIAAFTDVALRYLWTFTLFPTGANPYFHHGGFTFLNTGGFMAFIEIAELFRRAVWAIFRVENAHVSRKDEFRSYEYVPLFYEHTSLIEQQTKTNKPTSMLLETASIFCLVVIITTVIVLTQ